MYMQTLNHARTRMYMYACSTNVCTHTHTSSPAILTFSQHWHIKLGAADNFGFKSQTETNRKAYACKFGISLILLYLHGMFSVEPYEANLT